MITRTRTINPDGGFTEEITEEQSSAVVKVNAKGEFTWENKVYKDKPEEYEETAKKFLEAIGEVKQDAIKRGLCNK